jgi:hypothetical protein
MILEDKITTEEEKFDSEDSQEKISEYNLDYRELNYRKNSSTEIET